ncbi:vezatin adherens junctions transmembrane protein [Cricetulus griseus]
MTPEFDEEVVFENSPLYQYLQDLGHTDFEICSSLPPKTEKCLPTEGPQKPPTRVLPKQGILFKLTETIRNWTFSSQYSKKDHLLHKLDTGFRLDSLQTILQQEVLLQEDVELIELLDPSILSAGHPPQENGHLPTLCSLATPNVWDVSLLFAFISLLIMLPTWWIVSSWMVLFQLWVAQSSEFFRRLALLLSTANSPSGPLLTEALLPHRILSDVTQGLPHAHSACLEELKRSYEFFRYFETQHQSVPQRLSKTQQKSRELNNVHTAVRSLQLHLKALLNEVIILEDELEKLVCTKETQELLSEAYPILEQKLKLIEPHVQASNSCWEEAISQVDKLLRRNTDKKGKPEVVCENPHCTAAPLMRPALHIEDRDPIPEEQELEAYVDDIDIESEFRKDDLYHLSEEDKERQKREQEESRRVLQELKSVLGLKASEAERQKWKQLLFSDHAVLTSLSPVDPVESVSNSETPMNSDTGKVTRNDTEEENSEPSTRDIERNRTEFVCDSPPEGENKGASENEAFLQGTEERMSYQCESGAEFPQAAAAAAGATAPPTPRDSLQLSIKQRLARLQLSPEFTFTAGLAAEVAARSLSFTTMQEQTFGDEEEEQIAEGSENEVEEK